MVQHFTNFFSEPIANLDDYPHLSKWTPRVWYQTSGWNVTKNTAAIGKHLAVSPSGARKLATFNDVFAADVDLYSRFYVESGETPAAAWLAARADLDKNLPNNDASTHFYFGGLSQGNLIISKYVDGVLTNLVTTPAGSLGDEVCQRFSVVGSTLSLKVWTATDPEPASWSVTTTDTSITAAGGAGIAMTAFSGNPILKYVAFGAGTGTDSAPTAPLPVDFVALRSADTKTLFVASGTSVTVDIPDHVEAGDLILIPYYARAVINAPTGYTKSAETIYGIASQRSGVMWKIADGSEAGTSVTLTQASSARMEALAIIYEVGSAFEIANTDVATGTNFSAILEQTTAARALSLVFGVNGYAGGNSFTFAIHYVSDDEYFQVNTDRHPTSDSNRLQAFIGIFDAADTQNIQLDASGTRSWIATMVNFVESAPAFPTLSSAAATSVTANSAVPNVTVTVP